MTRIYKIKWYKKNKYGEVFERTSLIQIPKPTGNTEIDAKNALNVFVSSCGSLKYNTIVYIKELDENGNQIGEDIVPMDGEDAIIPIGK